MKSSSTGPIDMAKLDSILSQLTNEQLIRLVKKFLPDNAMAIRSAIREVLLTDQDKGIQFLFFL
jgi:hypothetical protein